MRDGKTPLDRGRRYDGVARVSAFAALIRRGTGPGPGEMAMTRRHRDEPAGARTRRFLALARFGAEG